MLGREKTPEAEKPVEKAPDRVELLEKIALLEREGRFDVDPEKDPPTIVLLPENVDYLKEKATTRIKSRFATRVAEGFVEDLIKQNKLIIKEVRGLENLNALEGGAVITCNHFNPFDIFALETVFRQSRHWKKKTLYKVIREGNYTNFPGLYGFFFRNCDTLPLSSDHRTMKEFLKAVDTILQREDFILIYPEQSLWWNYRKPKPLKTGAFKFASKNNVPVLPVFITMEDTDRIGEDGFPVQAYTVHIEEAIYPGKELTYRENTAWMLMQNEQVWKKVYEAFYQIPLTYTTEQAAEEKEDKKA